VNCAKSYQLQMPPPSGSRLPHRQQGIVLIVALLVLVALTIASLGLMRSVDTTTVAASNLGFKKDLYRQSSRGIQDAVNRLVPLRTSKGELPYVNNTSGAGYYATSTQLNPDSRGIPLILVNAPVPTTPGVGTATPGLGEFTVPIGDPSGGGYVFRYTAERLCPTTGESILNVNPCREASGSGAGGGQSRGPFLDLSGKIYVRLTLRIDGPKNSVSYFQAMIL
jgi:type IV pilus assembly protein PilX